MLDCCIGCLESPCIRHECPIYRNTLLERRGEEAERTFADRLEEAEAMRAESED